MSRLQSVVLTVWALAIAVESFAPPWMIVQAIGGSPGHVGDPAEAPRIAITRPLRSELIWQPPTVQYVGVRVDYGRLLLYYLGTTALVIPFFVWRRRAQI